jgi:predicted transcriptional regulator
MEKTTVYLPAELKEAIKSAARRRGVSEATVIRDSIRAIVAAERPRPRAGLFASGDPMGDRVDELLAGFGDR